MNRRSIGKRLAISISILLVIAIIGFAGLNGNFSKKVYATIWSRDYILRLDTVQKKIIAHGIKASSSHNLQPWLIKNINDKEVELYIDMDKDLSIVDSDHKQMLISHGTFIENYIQMAGVYGYEVNIDLIEPDFESEKPLVANLLLNESDKKVDTISGSSISTSQGGKDLQLISIALEALEKSDLGLEFEMIEDKFDVEELQQWLVAGVKIESTHEEAMKELLNVFRWTEYDKNNYRYGLTLNNISSFEAMFIQPFMKYSKVTWESFGQQEIDNFNKRMDDEFVYIFIRSKESDYKSYINVGRAYQRLITSGTGFTIRPNIQLLESYGELEAYGKQFQETYTNHEGHILMILGVQVPSNKNAALTPRHLVEDIMMND